MTAAEPAAEPEAVTTEAATEAAGTTPPDLFASLWAGSPVDAYVSRSMLLRQFPTGKGFGDTVWLHEPPAAPVCYFRVTPARFAGLLARLTKRKAALAEMKAPGVTLAGEDVEKAAELARVVERDAATLRLLRAEFAARWPEALKTVGTVVPEELDEPARPSDAWAVERQAETRPVAAAAPLAGPDADLAAWSKTAEAPAGAFRPTPYCVVLDGPAWLAKLSARANGDAAAARDAALRRLRELKAAAPAPASPAAESAARFLAGRP